VGGTFEIDRSRWTGGCLNIYDISGACVKKLSPDASLLFWNAAQSDRLKLSSGYYVIKMQDGSASRTVPFGKIR